VTKPRASLSTFTPVKADGARVGLVETKADIADQVEAPSSAASKKYPHVSVYLPADVIKTLKLVAIDRNAKVSDICAEAITEWMRQQGHERGQTFKA
jgi:hypothetical protein